MALVTITHSSANKLCTHAREFRNHAVMHHRHDHRQQKIAPETASPQTGPETASPASPQTGPQTGP